MYSSSGVSVIEDILFRFVVYVSPFLFWCLGWVVLCASHLEAGRSTDRYMISSDLYPVCIWSVFYRCTDRYIFSSDLYPVCIWSVFYRSTDRYIFSSDLYPVCILSVFYRSTDRYIFSDLYPVCIWSVFYRPLNIFF